MLKGMTVNLIKETVTGYDDFNQPIYSEESVAVEDCLVGQPSTDDITTSTELYGKKIALKIGVPKTTTTDVSDWVDAIVEIEGDRYKTVGYPEVGIQANIPLRWAFNVKVELYG